MVLLGVSEKKLKSNTETKRTQKRMTTCISSGNASSGALTELAAIGTQDAYLSINPEVTLFKQCYRRCTNFAIAEADLGFQSAVGFGRRATCVVPRNGDLLAQTYLALRVSALGVTGNQPCDANPAGCPIPVADAVITWTNAMGHAVICRADFEIGGTIFDTVHWYYLQIWERYAGKAGKYLEDMIGQFDDITDLRNWSARDQTLYIPLPFFYTRHYELSLPLIALQYHEVKITVTTRTRDELVVGFAPSLVAADPDDFEIPPAQITGGDMQDMVITANYIYLDTMERRIHAQQPHEFLITQLQVSDSHSVNAGDTRRQVQVHFNHPCLELFWFYQENRQLQAPLFRYFNFGIPDPQGAFPWAPLGPIPLVDPFDRISMQVNNHDRIASRGAFYFRKVPAWERHSSIPTIFAYNYCFALFPEDDKPSGSCNFSRIDNVCFDMSFALDPATNNSALTVDGTLTFMARNFNVMKIAGGMAALRHAN